MGRNAVLLPSGRPEHASTPLTEDRLFRRLKQLTGGFTPGRTLLHDPSSSPSPQVRDALGRLAKRSTRAAPGILWAILRPLAVLLASPWIFGAVARRLLRRKVRQPAASRPGLMGRALRILGVLVWVREVVWLLRDSVFRRRLVTDRREGVNCAPNSKAERVIRRMAGYGGPQYEYSAPWWMLTGDWSTVFATMLHRPSKGACRAPGRGAVGCRGVPWGAVGEARAAKIRVWCVCVC